MKILFILFSLTLASIASTSSPYCRGHYASNHSNCRKFHFNGRYDSGPGWNPRNLNLRHPSRFSSSREREYAVAVTNIFENGQPQTDYATCTNIGDGRGLTCGSAGYTTDDGSIVVPLRIYQQLCKRHHKYFPFGKYMKALISNTHRYSGSTSRFGGLAKLWTKQACHDPLFVAAQDKATYQAIDKWALAHAAYAHVHSNLGLLVFRDTMEQHGDGGGEPHIATERLMDLTHQAVGRHASEKKYITKFLDIRRQMLCCYHPYGDTTWPDSADRVADLQHIVASNNWKLHPPFSLPAYGFTVTSHVNIRKKPRECSHV